MPTGHNISNRYQLSIAGSISIIIIAKNCHLKSLFMYIGVTDSRMQNNSLTKDIFWTKTLFVGASLHLYGQNVRIKLSKLKAKATGLNP